MCGDSASTAAGGSAQGSRQGHQQVERIHVKLLLGLRWRIQPGIDRASNDTFGSSACRIPQLHQPTSQSNAHKQTKGSLNELGREFGKRLEERQASCQEREREREKGRPGEPTNNITLIVLIEC